MALFQENQENKLYYNNSYMKILRLNEHRKKWTKFQKSDFYPRERCIKKGKRKREN